jgi:16S rRNA (guanine527-N7)-methyltransferase
MFHVKPDIALILKQNGIEVVHSQLYQLETFSCLLLEWNRKINLISRKDEEMVWINHILLSLSFACAFDFKDGLSVLDLGTGGGLPGIPLSIIFPAVEFHLVDSIGKKISAVQKMIETLRLHNARATWVRAEDLKTSPGFRGYDAVIARSVSALSNLVEWSLPLLRKGGPHTPDSVTRATRPALPVPAIIALKGGDLDSEISLARESRPSVRFETRELVFPGSELLLNQEKKFVIVRPKVL